MASPLTPTPQVKASPALTAANRSVGTAVGTARAVVVPLPSCPASFRPQQYVIPASVIAQL
jgi:hypothetical protein